MRAEPKKMSDIEKQQFDELYQYVRKEILLYDEAQAIPSNLVLRLKGLSTGKLLENRNITDKAHYTFDIVLYTFQICKPQIMSAISGKDFSSERQKFNYICAIVENNLNDVYKRVQNAKKSESKIEEMDTNNLLHTGAEYRIKTEEIKSKRLENLW